MCLALFELSILNLLHKASKEFDVPGNLFLAISRESITEVLSIFCLSILINSPLRNPKSKFALCIISFFPFINFKKFFG